MLVFFGFHQARHIQHILVDINKKRQLEYACNNLCISIAKPTSRRGCYGSGQFYGTARCSETHVADKFSLSPQYSCATLCLPRGISYVETWKRWYALLPSTNFSSQPLPLALLRHDVQSLSWMTVPMLGKCLSTTG